MTTHQLMSDPKPEDRFSHLFNLIGDPVVEIELQNDVPRVVTVNPAFEAVFGYDRDRVRGESLNEFIVPEGYTDEATDFDQRTADGEYSTGVVTRQTATGQREFLYRGVPYERDGRQYAFAIYTDITDQKRREQQLREQNDRLDEFAGIVSHDLRNPLNAATLQLEALEQDCDSPLLDDLATSLDRMETIVDDTLRLAKEGRTVAEPERIDLSALVTECWESLAMDRATIEVDTPVTIRGDRGRIEQVFENLFRNAVEHGGQSVTIRVGLVDRLCAATRCSPDDRYAGFYVEDDGPGIPPEKRDAVFDADYTTDGTGFGLAIVEDVVDAHGWSIRVTEGRDAGARFEITDVDIID